jgi:hypothetical protein
LIHRPSGTLRRSVGSVRLILGGSSFSSQDMGEVLLLWVSYRGAVLAET